IETINKYIPDNGKAVEIAAGSGYTSVVVADLVRSKNATVIMTDLEMELVKSAKQRFGSISNLKFYQADSLTLPFDDNYFDVLFHQGFLEHFGDVMIKKFLLEQARISKYIVFDVPNSRRNNKTQEFGNERFLKHSEWVSLVKECGLNVYEHTARRFTNSWKKFVPEFIYNSNFFHKHFGEASIIVCGKY